MRNSIITFLHRPFLPLISSYEKHSLKSTRKNPGACSRNSFPWRCPAPLNDSDYSLKRHRCPKRNQYPDNGWCEVETAWCRRLELARVAEECALIPPEAVCLFPNDPRQFLMPPNTSFFIFSNSPSHPQPTPSSRHTQSETYPSQGLFLNTIGTVITKLTNWLVKPPRAENGGVASFSASSFNFIMWLAQLYWVENGDIRGKYSGAEDERTET